MATPQGRIHYVCPDFASPSGGMRRMYRHVHHLVRQGFDAVLVHEKRPFVADWHGYRVPMAWLSDRPLLRAEDIVVSSESTPALLKHLEKAPCRRVVCALHWAPHHLKLKAGQSWRDFGVSDVITPSTVIAEYVRWAMGLSATVIPSYVDPALFSPAEKTDSLVFMSRKDPAGGLLAGAFAGRGYAWHACDELPETEYAARLRAARIYLPPSTMEGFNASVLEAMACGCLVVGYHGIGGREFMRGEGPEQNCVLVENGDLPGFGTALEGVFARLKADPHAFDRVIANGLATAKGHLDPEPEARALADYYRGLLSSLA
jgi:hypothetical protein